MGKYVRYVDDFALFDNDRVGLRRPNDASRASSRGSGSLCILVSTVKSIEQTGVISSGTPSLGFFPASAGIGSASAAPPTNFH